MKASLSGQKPAKPGQRSPASRYLRYLVWLALPVLLWLVYRQIPHGLAADIQGILKSLRPSQLVMLIAMNLFITVLFSSRWWLILRALGQRVPYSSLAGYRLAGFAISYFTPGTQFGGEPLQVYLLEKRHGIPAATALASVTLDKIFELLANFTFLVAGILLILGGAGNANGGLLAGLANGWVLWFVIGMLGLPLVYLSSLWLGRLPLGWLVARLPARLKGRPTLVKISRLAEIAEGQIAQLIRQRPWLVLGILSISGLVWALSIGEYWLTLSFLGSRISLFQTISALTAARLAFLTPLPGGLGALEASQILAMQALGFGPALGLSMSLLIRGRDICLGLAGLGWGAYLTRRISLSSTALPAVD